jgi:hypothetical protein
LGSAVDAFYPAADPGRAGLAAQIKAEWVDAIGTSVEDPAPSASPPAGALTDSQLLAGLVANIPSFTGVLKRIADDRNILPATPAMAGIFAANDRNIGVWSAPANAQIEEISGPTIAVDDQAQQDLNTPVSGIAVNAIRTFTGRGTLVWGARTMDGNSGDWRYIPVRRTIIYIEQSVKLALRSFAFEPNNKETWEAVKAMIGNFLITLWKSGGLVGSTPVDAFNLQAGLGSTMTADDILSGILRVQVLVAVTHPAEFIVISFQQEMQGS